MSNDDPLGSIELKDEEEKKIQDAIPLYKEGKAAFESAAAAAEGTATAAETTAVAADAKIFTEECSNLSSDYSSDPISFLVSNGLDFLLVVFQPLQDALHTVTGDGPALSAAAESFNNIGTGLADFGKQFAEQSKSALAEWQGEAAEAAGARFGEFANGIQATAGEAGDIAHLLQISSMVMSVIESFIKALITELVTWAISIWIPALAAAGPTFGGSTAAAGSATAVRASMTTARATSQVSKLQRLLDMIKNLLTKIRGVLAKLGNTASATSRQNTTFTKSMLNAGWNSLKDQVADPKTFKENMSGGKSALEYENVGTDRSTERTQEQLDF